MNKYHKSLDLVIAGAIAFSQNRPKEAAKFFAAAADDPQFNKMVDEVSQEQEGLLDSPADSNSDLSKQQKQDAAVAAFRRKLKRRAMAEATDDDGPEDDSDDEEEDDDATAEVEDPAEDDDSDAAESDKAVEEAARRVEANLRFVRRSTRK